MSSGKCFLFLKKAFYEVKASCLKLSFNIQGGHCFFEKQIPGYFGYFSKTVFVWPCTLFMLDVYEIIWHDTFG